MANYGTYAVLGQLKDDVGIAAATTTYDTTLRRRLERASRMIDEYCGRHFYALTATRTFTANKDDRFLLPYDLLSITTLKHDEDSDWDYDYTWATTDYHLLPLNEFPKWEIRTKDEGDYTFPDQEEGVQIAGLWGYGDRESATPWEDSTTTTNEELDASETVVTLTSGAAVDVGYTMRVESEDMYITALSANDATVVRGINGTTAATHATSKIVYLHRYPAPIVEGCLRLANRLWALKNAPLGLVSGDMGTTVIQRDYELMRALDPFRRISVG